MSRTERLRYSVHTRLVSADQISSLYPRFHGAPMLSRFPLTSGIKFRVEVGRASGIRNERPRGWGRGNEKAGREEKRETGRTCRVCATSATRRLDAISVDEV